MTTDIPQPAQAGETADLFVYWLLNADDECIYVGSSCDPERRWHEHHRRLGPEIVTRRVAGPFTRSEGLAKELAEQKRLTPKYNGRLNGMPVRFSTWDGSNCIESPDQDVLRCAAELIVAKYLARRLAS